LAGLAGIVDGALAKAVERWLDWLASERRASGLTVEAYRDDVARFLSFVAHQDFSASIPVGRKGPIFRELEAAYSVLMAEFRTLNQEKAANYQYLESLVEHVSIALLCLDDEGVVKLANGQAKRLFKLPYLHSVKSLQRLDPKLPELITELGDGGRAIRDPVAVEHRRRAAGWLEDVCGTARGAGAGVGHGLLPW